MKNYDLMRDYHVDRFKENLKHCICDGAGMLSLDELQKVCGEVMADTVSFLEKDAVRVRQGASEVND